MSKAPETLPSPGLARGLRERREPEKLLAGPHPPTLPHLVFGSHFNICLFQGTNIRGELCSREMSNYCISRADEI